MKPQAHLKFEKYRVTIGPMASKFADGNCGAFKIPRDTSTFVIIASDGRDWAQHGFPLPVWEHVSVSVYQQKRPPNWYEMVWVKNLFWDPEELVIQFHPPKSAYVNHHEGCLHLWKPVDFVIPLPPSGTLV